MNYSRKINIEYRDSAIQVLEKVKRREQIMNMIPLHISKVNRTVIMIPSGLNKEEREEKIRKRLRES